FERVLRGPLCARLRLPRRCSAFPYTPLFRSRRPRSSFASTCPSCESAMQSPPCSTRRPSTLFSTLRALTWPRSSWSRWATRCGRSEEHTSELQSRENLVCRLLLEKNNERHDP